MAAASASTTPSAADAEAAPSVTFFTDVEGNWEYFLRFIELSEALDLIGFNESGAADLSLKDGWMAVFGGDAVDKGPEGGVGGSVRVVRTLVALKEKYGSRVVLILGNRDLNKMRLTSELAASQLRLLEDVPGPYWVASARRVSFVKYLERATGSSDMNTLRRANTAAHRLRWILSYTMGAEGEFERRQRELTMLRGERAPHEAVSEDDVVADFVESLQVTTERNPSRINASHM